ncbi:carbamoyl phosphate synthase small subunit [Polycladomyces subterraneus]|uniref:Carbamoyl phosphate synthase small chain n=1 Tax=Polycladomyces subterraneus TaxID=1016997 RepID=A0ABT8IIS9_9BACL|nr:carbamoyl phosphate synthase small subunit [Polycladomyces subterraneus]MDN4592703.1 carbamoyl phosphate synthase small subunit [Polycladomyces subterraneus]
MKAYLVLDTGDVFEGTWIGRPSEVLGEVVFTTGMTGYQEVLTDPSYAGQIVTFTYPLLGNYGIVPGEEESVRPHCAGVILSETYEQADTSLSEWLHRHGVTGIAGVDTRTVVKIVREKECVRGVISSVPNPQVEEWPDPCSPRWVSQVSVTKPVTYAGDPFAPHIVLVDFGAKASILRSMQELGCRVTVVPFHLPPSEVAKLEPDGLLFSNGPGDPKALLPYLSEWVPFIQGIPTLGICLGHQLLALALGGDTDRLSFGHRGSNHPVKELETGRVWITSQNHGYAVREESLDPAQWRVTHRHIHDGSVEGIAHRQYPIQGVQFHPEAHPGPSDAAEIFHRFIEMVQQKRKVTIHVG